MPIIFVVAGILFLLIVFDYFNLSYKLKSLFYMLSIVMILGYLLPPITIDNLSFSFFHLVFSIMILFCIYFKSYSKVSLLFFSLILFLIISIFGIDLYLLFFYVLVVIFFVNVFKLKLNFFNYLYFTCIITFANHITRYVKDYSDYDFCYIDFNLIFNDALIIILIISIVNVVKNFYWRKYYDKKICFNFFNNCCNKYR